MSETTVPQRRSPLRFLSALVPLAAGLAVGVAMASLLDHWLPDVDLTPVQKLVLILALVLLLLLVLGLHEAGHLLGGRLVGFRALLYVVGPLKIERAGERFQIGLNRSAALWGGVASSVPLDRHDLRRRMLVMVAGGPVASLLGGATVLGLTALTAPRLAEGASFPDFLLLSSLVVFGAGSAAIGVITLIPGRTGGFLTDGARILRFLRQTPETEGEVAILALTGMSLGGQRPREWAPALVEQSLAAGDGSLFGPIARLLAFAHAVDLGRIEEAREHLEEALAQRDLLPEAARPGLLLEAVWFVAVHEGDSRRARSLLEQVVGGILIAPYQRLLAEAAVLWREGDPAGARERLEKARPLLRQAVDAGGARASADRIEELLRVL